MSSQKTYISIGDFVDIYHKIRQKGIGFIISKLNWSSKSRIQSKWDFFDSSSDFWLIPAIQKRWNFMISGNENVEYEAYVYNKYLQNKTNLRLLSIGCGEGIHDRNFAKFNCFSSIDAVDISEGSIKKALEIATEMNLQINYQSGDFKKLNFKKDSFDVILFSSSLHHFEGVFNLLKNDVNSLLSENGILVIYEYVGPNRLQWTTEQLKKANILLDKMPTKFKLLYDNKSIKKKVYRPGIFRMLLVDPSEAPDSKNIVSALNTNFKVLEQTNLGWNILHILLKGIAHNFCNDQKETQELLTHLFAEEDAFVLHSKSSDAIFGVYQKTS
jgi:2-polyprenyl-3-methyl-5-hydroxy-6-metoxy-1,4-benzoquinol methylase